LSLHFRIKPMSAGVLIVIALAQPNTTGRLITVKDVSGTVELSVDGSAASRVPQVGETLLPGMSIRTGGDGQIVLEQDDGTVMVIASNATFSVEVMQGSPANPITRFFLNAGRIFAFREGREALPADASFEIETPEGIAAIRGSSMAVEYNPAVSSGTVLHDARGKRVMQEEIDGPMTVICISGTCIVETAQGSITLYGGQWVEIDENGNFSEIRSLSQAEIDATFVACQAAQNAELLLILNCIELLAPNPPDTPVPSFTPTNIVLPTATYTPTVISAPTMTNTPGYNCGDGYCSYPAEDTSSCSGDCACIDDGVCQPPETDLCQDCLPPTLTPTNTATSTCGNGTCDVNVGEHANNCASDCNNFCGDNVCQYEEVISESCYTSDCAYGGYCGNYICETPYEKAVSLARKHPPFYGPNGESSVSCPKDCVDPYSYCGDGYCDDLYGPENSTNCPADCP